MSGAGVAPGLVAMGLAAGVALAVCGGAWVLSRGRLHRADRLGAAGLAVGFVAGHQQLAGHGWRPDEPATTLPLVAVVGALLVPRVLARVAPTLTVPIGARAFVLLAAAGSAATLSGAGRADAARLVLALLGAVIGVAVGGALPLGPDAAAADAFPAAGGVRRDPRPGTWLLAAGLLGLVPVLAA